MRVKLLLLFVLSGHFLTAQTPPFDNAHGGSAVFADIDGDGDQDVLITGISQTSPLKGTTQLYTNDGKGNFTKATGTAFDVVTSSVAAFADVDNDGDQDVLIIGMSSAKENTAKLYTNDGKGRFTEVKGTPFTAMTSCSITFTDTDGDGDQDVLITGAKSWTYLSKLYTNDGKGNFTEVSGTPFDGAAFSGVAFSDVNGDGSKDVLILGRKSKTEYTGKLYGNNGQRGFTAIKAAPFEGTVGGSAAFADVDGDGDQDALVTGATFSKARIAKMYINDGKGNFKESGGTPFEGVANGSSGVFTDVNGDGSEDVIITGTNRSGKNAANLYLNDGKGNFRKANGTPFTAVSSSSIACSDVDNDGDQDVLISGYSDVSKGPSTKLYINDGKGNFTEAGTKSSNLSDFYLEYVSGAKQSYSGGGMPKPMVIKVKERSTGNYVTDLSAKGLSLEVSSNVKGKYDDKFNNLNDYCKNGDKACYGAYYYVPPNSGNQPYKLQVRVNLLKNGEIQYKMLFTHDIKG